ncbi:MAG: SusC/RagA family TonB-linked outer membrane protein [Gemmatimonadota bacterium]|nr:SusC/RagA family TonB-linked outer membrane protein [Gemmatimonadota bacterium]
MSSSGQRRSHPLVHALFSVLLFLGLPALVHGQGATITGRVASEQGNPLEVATVFITELALNATTDAEGRYTINVPAARVSGQPVILRVRRIGHLAASRPITLTAGSQTVDFALKQDINRLQEVVVTGVVGAGTERSKVPFSVGRVTAEDLPVPALDPLRALAGKVAGMRVAQTGGRPGSTPEIMLRGPTSINAAGRGQGPLIIVDGTILNVGSLEELGALDIESVEVVKGAAGASLYGTRAANGVITITTKRGSTQDGIRFNVRSEYGVSDLNSINYGMPLNHQLQLDETGTRFCVLGSSNIASCSRTVDWMQEILRINSVAADTLRTPQSIQHSAPSASGGDLQNVFQSQSWPRQYYNPLAQAIRRNPVMLNSIDANGKVGSVRFYVSGSYQDEQGALKGLRGIQQRRGRVNLDYEARQDLTFQISTLYDKGTRDINDGGLFGQVLRGMSIGTNYMARDSLGRAILRSGGASLRSPTGNGGSTYLYEIENSARVSNTNRFLSSITSRYFPTDWVTFEGTFGYDNRQRFDDEYREKGYRTFSTSTAQNNGNIFLFNRNQEALNGSLSANFQKQLMSDLLGKLVIRGLFDEDNVQVNEAYKEVFLVKDVHTLSNASQNPQANSFSQTIRNQGYMAGASFDYKDRYIVDGTIRRDGSSLFGPGNRWATFGRVSGVWRVSEEPFWAVPYMSDFRLRASRGTAGSTPRFTAQYETYNVSQSGITLGQAGNSELKPETTTETELGTELTLFDRLGLEVTHARSSTRDQILLVNTPASLGFSTQWQNAGTLANRTWEVAMNLPVVSRENLQWNMRGTWDRTRTYITELFAPEYVSDAGTTQGTSSTFHITSSREKSNGFQQNRLGNIWGRKFYKGCGDLPASVRTQCGAGQAFQVNDQGWVVWVGEGNSWRDGITKNLWQTKLPGADSPWGVKVPLYFGHPIIDRPLSGEPNEGNGIQQIIGNTFPDFRFGYSNTIQYKKLGVHGLFEGTIGHDIYNQGEGWGLLDFSSAYFDAANKSVETAKPMGYQWRAGPSESTGTGGFYDVLGPNNYVVEDGSFVKLREVSLTYDVGAIAGLGDFTLGLIGRNLWTITNYSGLDPETGATGGANQSGSGLINQVDAFGFPTLRTFTFSVSTRF